MGYKVKPKQYRLKFRDAEFEGLEVVMGSMSVGEWERLMAPAPLTAAERAAESDWGLQLFAERVISWNLEDDAGRPVPLTVAALKDLDRAFLNAVVSGWQLAIIGVDPTSSGASPGGEPPAETADPLTAETLAAMSASSSPGTSM